MPTYKKRKARSPSYDSEDENDGRGSMPKAKLEEEKYSRGGMQNLFAKKQAQMSVSKKSDKKQEVNAPNLPTHNDIVQAFDANGNFLPSKKSVLYKFLSSDSQ